MSLLSIPREIRDEILSLAILAPVDLPTPEAVDDGKWHRRPEAVWQRKQSTTALPLLLVSRQISIETARILERLPADYGLDVMYLKDRGLWTTWSIPTRPRSRYIGHVRATFRPFEPTGETTPGFRDLMDFRGGDGGPPRGVWTFYELLVGLLRSGPGGSGNATRDDDEASYYIVRRITVDVLAPVDGVEHRSCLVSNAQYEKMRPRLGLGWGHDDTAIPLEKRVATIISRSLPLLLSLTSHSFDYATEVMENVVEGIDILVNGEPHASFDIGRLASVRFGRDNFGTWDERAVERESRYGLWRVWFDERRRRMEQGLELDDTRPVSFIM